MPLATPLIGYHPTVLMLAEVKFSHLDPCFLYFVPVKLKVLNIRN